MRVTKKIQKNILFALCTFACMILFFGACCVLKEKLEYTLYPLRYIRKFSLIPLISIVVLLSALTGKRKFSVSVAVSMILGIMIGQMCGAHSYVRSPLEFNEGWLGLAVCGSIGLIAGVAAEYISYRKENGSVFQNGKSAIAKFLIIVLCTLLFVAATSFLSVKKLKFNFGAETGYTLGFETGKSAAQDGAECNFAFAHSVDKVPENFTFGTAQFSGFALYWGSGYKDGYQDVGDCSD